MLHNSAYFFSLLTLAFLSIALVYRRSIDPFIFLLVPISMVGRSLLIFIDSHFDIFGQKKAGARALELFEIAEVNGLGAIARDTFYMQTLLNYPGLKLFSENNAIIIITNVLCVTLAAIAAHWYFYRVAGDKRRARLAACVFAVSPSALFFSLTGLRDPLIFLAVTIIIVTALTLFHHGLRSGIFALVFFSLSAGALASLRPELVPLILVFPIMLILINIKRGRDASVQSVHRFRKLIISSVYIGVFCLSLLLYPVVLSQVGVSPDTNPVELVESYTQARYERQFHGSGGGSPILPPSIYNQMPTLARPLVQILGMYLIPPPWLWNRIDRVLALTDTVLVFGFLVLWLRRRKKLDAISRYVSFALVATFTVSLVIMGLVVINSGNALRMRFVVTPFVLFLGSLCWSLRQARMGLSGRLRCANIDPSEAPKGER